MTTTEALVRVKGHYEIEGVLYPSVTTILQVINKPALLNWAAKNGPAGMARIKQESADFGTTVHRYISEILDGKAVDLDALDPEIAGCVRSFQEWARLVSLQPIITEQTIHSKTHGYAGTLDFFGLVYGVPTLIDWKTSSGIYPEMELQVAAYSFALDEMGLGKSVNKMIVRIDKKTKQCHPTVVTAGEEAFGAFLSAKKLWLWLQEAEKPATDKWRS